jgi:hypothetical protein
MNDSITGSDALPKERGSRPQTFSSWLQKGILPPPMVSATSKDNGFHDDKVSDESLSQERLAHRQLSSSGEPATFMEIPDASSMLLNAGSEDSWNPSGKDDRPEPGAQPQQKREDKSRNREEDLEKEEELLKRVEAKRREHTIKWLEHDERERANRVTTSSGGGLKHYPYDMSPGHSYHEISPPRPHPLYPSPAMPPAYIPESGIARSRPTGLQPGDAEFFEWFTRTHARGLRQPIKCTLTMGDIFGEFSVSELGGDSFWDLVVLIGRPYETTDGGPWATTCQDYVARTWPQSTEKIKDMFSLLSANGGNIDTKKQLVSVSGGEVLVSTSHHLSRDGERKLSVSLDGPAESQADMVESLTWLFAVLQNSHDEHRPIASGVEWIRRRSDPAQVRNFAYELSSNLLEPLMVPYYSACWTPLLPSTACAVDFGTRGRPWEMKGLEVSFELMCYLSGLEYEVIENNGLVLYGQVSNSQSVRSYSSKAMSHLR